MVHLVNVNIKMILNLNTLVLSGFQPKSPCEWSLRHACGRCERKCGQASICKSGDGFVKVEILENVPLVVTMTTIVRTNKRSKVSSWPQFSSSIPNVVAEFHVL